eukprot:CAMPEP_0198330076 /NCGR_PEP_ID=MMETSP1450-20131203/16662_1 /TAXON_ID=753684 ORGANISM="Madagascaria erythrocladiodes, Strain CCMP3234" /NCGR_SAMPLE_ID=MMETSP1450 /ASSEMBLY_ACC=CAM_ASM_001115 /LENGTH=573 /DNA_ID=CAMNT_0044034341 /DNA_START=111 /DNA_END=1828 /DNA_ORIENTATION=-
MTTVTCVDEATQCACNTVDCNGADDCSACYACCCDGGEVVSVAPACMAAPTRRTLWVTRRKYQGSPGRMHEYTYDIREPTRLRETLRSVAAGTGTIFEPRDVRDVSSFTLAPDGAAAYKSDHLYRVDISAGSPCTVPNATDGFAMEGGVLGATFTAIDKGVFAWWHVDKVEELLYTPTAVPPFSMSRTLLKGSSSNGLLRPEDVSLLPDGRLLVSASYPNRFVAVDGNTSSALLSINAAFENVGLQRQCVLATPSTSASTPTYTSAVCACGGVDGYVRSSVATNNTEFVARSDGSGGSRRGKSTGIAVDTSAGVAFVCWGLDEESAIAIFRFETNSTALHGEGELLSVHRLDYSPWQLTLGCGQGQCSGGNNACYLSPIFKQPLCSADAAFPGPLLPPTTFDDALPPTAVNDAPPTTFVDNGGENPGASTPPLPPIIGGAVAACCMLVGLVLGMVVLLLRRRRNQHSRISGGDSVSGNGNTSAGSTNYDDTRGRYEISTAGGGRSGVGSGDHAAITTSLPARYGDVSTALRGGGRGADDGYDVGALATADEYDSASVARARHGDYSHGDLQAA